MNKRFLFGFIIGAAALAAAVLWLLSVLVPDTFGWFSGGWAVVLISGVAGLAFVLKGVCVKESGVLKKLSILIGAGLLIICFIQLAVELALPKNAIAPIITVIVVAALLLGYVVVGGKKWDSGDNQKVGYKNYYQRKAEEEKKAAEAAKEAQKANKD